MKTASLTCAALALALATLSAHAETLRCGTGYIVKAGDNKADVLQNCGEPVMRDTFCSASRNDSSCGNIEEWTYNPGPGQFMTTLRFVEGRLQSIRYGNRVR